MPLAETHATDLELLAQTRRQLLGMLEEHSLEQLNRIPAGFNNNLIWNAAHCWVTQVLLTRGLGQLGFDLPEEFVATYRKGGAPGKDVTAEELEFIREGLRESPNELARDLDAEDWTNFKPYRTSYGASMANISEAVRFNNAHEAMHLGVMLAQRKLV